MHCLIIFTFTPAFSEEKSFEGEISVKGTLADVDGDQAKFNEYRDITDGLYSRIRLKYDSDAYFMKFKAADIGYDSQKYSLGGGLWGIFSYNLFYDEIPHNITFGARSFYSGIGGNILTGTPNTLVSSWNAFDYSTERKQYGAGFKLDLLKPFFLEAAFSREDKKGIKPSSAGAPASFPFIIIALPEPVDYRTESVSLETGYVRRPFFASLAFYYNRFENADNNLFFDTGFSTDTLTLPPDNSYHKISFKGAVDLPLQSRLSLNMGTATARSDADLLGFTSSADTRFDGKVDTKNADVVLVTNPATFLNARGFYKYYNRKNRSDEIDDGALNTLFDYRKNSYGLEVSAKLPARFSLAAGYRRYKTNYNNRIDVDRTMDDFYDVSLKWAGLDYLNAMLGYEKLKRNTGFITPADPAVAAVERFIGRYDAAPLDRDTFKISIDIMPVETLNFTLGYRYKKTDYNDTILGLREDKRDEFSIDAGYSISKVAQLSAYFDYEKIRSLQFQRQFSPGDDPDPGSQDASNFNWNLLQKEKTFDYGAAADIFILPRKLTLRLQHDNIRSDGNADFTYLFPAALPAGSTNDNIDISNADDYRRRSFLAKLIYEFSKSISLSTGYSYEKYTYSDIQLDDYQYILPGFPSGFLAGAYKDQAYKANVVFFGISYKF